MTDLRKVLASNMKLYRKIQGLSQAKLAEKMDVTENYIAMLETGRRFPSLTVLEGIATALKIDPLELFFMKPAKVFEKRVLKEQILTDIEQILTFRFNEWD